MPILRGKVPAGSRLLVAVSGGPDSVALLHLLKQLPYPLVIGHVDHGLRQSSTRDAQFVKRLAALWEIPCRVRRVGTRSYARQNKRGIEEAGRELRYKALAAMARRFRCQAIVTGHTADDQAETVLMNFLRGSGGTGLSGIPEARPLNSRGRLLLLRPLLGFGRRDILSYLSLHALDYRKDPSNELRVYARNRIRHDVLPWLDQLYPGLPGRLGQMADLFRQEEDFWQAQVDRVLRKTARQNGPEWTVVLPRLFGYHKALVRRILRHLMPGSSFLDMEQVLRMAQSKNATGKLELSSAWRVFRSKDKLVVRHKRNG